MSNPTTDLVTLERVLRRHAEAVHNLVADETSDQDTRTLRDGAELIRVLARMVAGKTIQEVHRAFGAPGDWGYETPIGNTLSNLYTPKTVDVG